MLSKITPGPALILSFAVAAMILITLSFASLDRAPPEKDGLENALYAYHLATANIFSDDKTDVSPQPGYFREPLYPFFLSLVLRAYPGEDYKRSEIACLTTLSTETCPSLRLALKLPNILFNTLLMAALGAAAWQVTKSWRIAALVMLFMSANTTFISYSSVYYSEPLATLLLFLHAYGLFRASMPLEKNRTYWALMSGVTLGLMILVKAAFLYIAAVTLVCGLVLMVFKRVRNAPIPAAALIMPFVLALCIAAPWMVRNHLIGAGWNIADRGPEVLSIRASYDMMPWSDVPNAMLQFTPILGGSIKKSIMGDEAYARFSRRSGTSYYRRAQDEVGPANILAREKNIPLQAASIELIRENFLHHLVLTGVFAYNQSFPPVTFSSKSLPLADLYGVIRLFYTPMFVIFLIYAARRCRLDYLALAVTVVMSFGFHAFLTHGIPRFTIPYVPIYVLSAVMYFHDGYKRRLIERSAAAPA